MTKPFHKCAPILEYEESKFVSLTRALSAMLFLTPQILQQGFSDSNLLEIYFRSTSISTSEGYIENPVQVDGPIMVYDAIDVFFSRYGYNWRQLRKICIRKLLSPKRLEFFCFQREEKVSVMVHSLLEECTRISDPVVDVCKIIPNVAVNIMCRMVFGRKYSDEETYDT